MKLRPNTKKKPCRKNKHIFGRSIEERPPEVEERKELGHWEIDTVIGSLISAVADRPFVRVVIASAQNSGLQDA